MTSQILILSRHLTGNEMLRKSEKIATRKTGEHSSDIGENVMIIHVK